MAGSTAPPTSRASPPSPHGPAARAAAAAPRHKRGGRGGDAHRRPGLPPRGEDKERKRRGDAGSHREVAACGKGGERRVSPRRALRQPPSSGAPSPAARSPAPAPAAPRRRRKGGREAAQPSGPGCSFASSPLPCSSSTAWITATAKPAAGDAARELAMDQIQFAKAVYLVQRIMGASDANISYSSSYEEKE